MSRIATGWRLAKDSWAALKADRSLAIGVIFRVELYRYATEGRVADGFEEKDLVGAFRPGEGAARR